MTQGQIFFAEWVVGIGWGCFRVSGLIPGPGDKALFYSTRK